MGSMSLIGAILPKDVFHAEQLGEISGELLPSERLALGSAASLKRQREFAAGRACARLALKNLGITDTPILVGPRREPLWPSGIAGSITHCDGYCAAAVAYQSKIVAIGIDAELNCPLSEDTLSLIAFDQEIEWLDKAPDIGINWDKLLFSIKESVYKVWYPANKTWLGFEDVRVSIDLRAETFEVVVNPVKFTRESVELTSLCGLYMANSKLLLTAVSISR